MPKRPKGEERPADAIGNAVMIARIATREIEDITTEDGKNAAAVALGRMDGKARAAGMSAKKRSEIAKKAAKSRWKDSSTWRLRPNTELMSRLRSYIGSFAMAARESMTCIDWWGKESPARHGGFLIDGRY